MGIGSKDGKMNFETAGKWLFMLGIGLALLGGLIWLAGRVWPGLSNLPGTIRIQGAGVTCVIPLLASILLSVLLTVLLNIAARLLK
jgi:hypothetical protein